MQGRPWTPYQRFIASVAGELEPDGAYAYPVVVLTMPRQCAKTSTAYDVALGRGRAYRDYRARYATHKGSITSERFLDWFAEAELHPALAAGLKLNRSRGSEALAWRKTRSYFRAFPALPGALRSAALDLVVVDEAQEHGDVIGAALKKQINATFNTRRRRQLWVVFSAGTDASTYAAGYLARGLAHEPGVAIFDYGCPPDVDPLDPALWASWHPGLAYGLTDTAALTLAAADDAAGFVREYGNTWTRTEAGLVIADAAWRAVQLARPMPDGPLYLGVDVSADRASASIAIAGPGHVELVEHRAGTTWLVARALELQARWGAPIAIDTKGPVGLAYNDLDRAGADLLPMTFDDVAVAFSALVDAVNADPPAVTFYPHPALDDALQVATTRPAGDGGLAWSRRTSNATIAPLVAATAAHWAATRHTPKRRPAARAR